MSKPPFELLSVSISCDQSPDEVEVHYSKEFVELGQDAADELTLRAVYSILQTIRKKRVATHGEEWAKRVGFNLPTW